MLSIYYADIFYSRTYISSDMNTDYPPDWNSRRKKVYERDGYECQNCGRQGGSTGHSELHAHHIVPKEKGGTHKLSNLISVCEQCHESIHNNKDAPTKYSQSGLSELKGLVPRVKEFLEYAQGGLSVESPGKIQNDKLEKERISIIQDLGRFSIVYEAPDNQKQQAMDDMIQTWIRLLRFPEDVWEKLESGEMSRDEAKEFSLETTEKKKR